MALDCNRRPSIALDCTPPFQPGPQLPSLPQRHLPAAESARAVPSARMQASVVTERPPRLAELLQPADDEAGGQLLLTAPGSSRFGLFSVRSARCASTAASTALPPSHSSQPLPQLSPSHSSPLPTAPPFPQLPPPLLTHTPFQHPPASTAPPFAHLSTTRRAGRVAGRPSRMSSRDLPRSPPTSTDLR